MYKRVSSSFTGRRSDLRGFSASPPEYDYYAPVRPTGNPGVGNVDVWNRYNDYTAARRTYDLAMAKGSPAIRIAEIQTAPAMILAPAQASATLLDAQSLGSLRVSQGGATTLRARTQNLRTTADVSQEVQKPVQAEGIKALPWMIGGAVALGLIGLILHRTRK